MNADNLTSLSLLSPGEMARLAEATGCYKSTKHPLKTFFSAFMAGIFIAIAFVFYITVTTGTAGAPYGFSKLLGGLCFSLGLILVVVCGADLFTSSVLLIVARATGQISWFQLLRNWLIVYIGNLFGALFFVALIWLSDQHLAANGNWGLNVLQTADHKVHHTFLEAFSLGVLANLMVCLAVWMSYAGRSLTDKMLVMVLPVAMFVASGFEHCIANMFMVPMGIILKNYAGPEFWQMIHALPEHYAGLTTGRFLWSNLLPVTLGNIVGGGVLVGLTNWAINLRNVHQP